MKTKIIVLFISISNQYILNSKLKEKLKKETLKTKIDFLPCFEPQLFSYYILQKKSKNIMCIEHLVTILSDCANYNFLKFKNKSFIFTGSETDN